MSKADFTNSGTEISVDIAGDESKKRRELLESAIKLAVDLRRLGPSDALDASINTVDQLLAAIGTQCRRAAPPADIVMTTNASGKLIYRCKHKNPAHEWDV